MIKKLVVSFIICFIGATIHGQDLNQTRNDSLVDGALQGETFDPVVISATRTKRQLSSLPLPTQLIDKQEITSINSMRLTDLLSEQTGLVTV